MIYYGKKKKNNNNQQQQQDNKEEEEKQNNNNNENDYDNYLTQNVSDTVCNQLGILIPFGNWTLSYSHPNIVNNNYNDICGNYNRINNIDFTKYDKK